MTKLIDFRHPLLYKETISPISSDVVDIVAKMKEVMIENRGVGLSANQIGYPYSIFIVGNYLEPETIEAFINPKITLFDGEQTSKYEGCLSFPRLSVPVNAYDKIRMVYTTIDGVIKSQIYSGYMARICQHEIKHLKGKPFFQGVSRLKLDMAVRKTNKKYGTKYDVSELYRMIKD